MYVRSLHFWHTHCHLAQINRLDHFLLQRKQISVSML